MECTERYGTNIVKQKTEENEGNGKGFKKINKTGIFRKKTRISLKREEYKRL